MAGACSRSLIVPPRFRWGGRWPRKRRGPRLIGWLAEASISKSGHAIRTRDCNSTNERASWVWPQAWSEFFPCNYLPLRIHVIPREREREKDIYINTHTYRFIPSLSVSLRRNRIIPSDDDINSSDSPSARVKRGKRGGTMIGFSVNFIWTDGISPPPSLPLCPAFTRTGNEFISAASIHVTEGVLFDSVPLSFATCNCRPIVPYIEQCVLRCSFSLGDFADLSI